MTLQTKVGDGFRQRARATARATARTSRSAQGRVAVLPTGPGQAPDLVGCRLASALGEVAEDEPALATMRLDERVEANTHAKWSGTWREWRAQTVPAEAT